MHGVDTANERRHDYSTQRKRIFRTWKPLFHFLLCTALSNCYYLRQAQLNEKRPKALTFRKLLIEALWAYKAPKAPGSHT